MVAIATALVDAVATGDGIGDAAALARLRNLGPASAGWLVAAGID